MDMQPPDRAVGVPLATGSSGSLWPLKQTIGAGGEFRIRDWTIHARPGRSFIEVLAPTPSLSWLEHASMAEQALDLMSVAGGQHYERESFTPKNQRIKWDWKGDKFVIEVQMVWKAEVPLTMFVGPAPAPHDDDPLRKPLYTNAMRYFRVSQSAATIAAAYQNLFLCFEALLCAKVPKAQEREEDWLQRAASELVAGYEERARKEIEQAGGLKKDLERIYALRLALFHAKQDRNPLLPGDPLALDSTEQIYWRLVDHVRELLRPYGVWPETTRLGTVREINRTGTFLLDLTHAGIIQDGAGLTADFLSSKRLSNPETTFDVRWHLPQGWPDAIRGFSWTFGATNPKHWLTFMPVCAEPAEIHVNLAVGGGFRHLIRCPDV